MPWLGDGTWVQDAGLARDIVHGRTNYRPHSGVTTGLTIKPKKVKDGKKTDNQTHGGDGEGTSNMEGKP